MITSRFTHSACAALLSVILTAQALAGPAPRHVQPLEDGYYVYADVVEVSPRYGWHEVSEPVRRCVQVDEARGDRHWHDDRRPRYERHGRRDRHRRDGDVGAGLVGGLLGGLIGNQFGGGDGRKALTVVGALIGASVARDHVREHDKPVPRYRHSAQTWSGHGRHCTESHRTRRVRGVEAYDVTYRYQGATFHKRLDEHPGDVIRIRVAVEPVE